ncbi:hypothetical protein N7493_000887 [Penicillium malachiteum]|uniref:Uncharacterized protein n=1 Tax=Penicillium malachiteum TaxID=1324776 RepID=A0AAD6HX96_9EURO|nr:hypothetical protein N7493_000887 [Penicillium malachiteum]
MKKEDAPDSSRAFLVWKASCWISILIAVALVPAIWYSIDSKVLAQQSSIARIHLTRRTFDHDPLFENLTTHKEVLAAWEVYDLPGPVRVTDKIYVMSAFHQLRCLRDMQLSLIHLQEGVPQSFTENN